MSEKRHQQPTHTARAQCWFLKHLQSFEQEEIWNFGELVTLATVLLGLKVFTNCRLYKLG